MYKWNEIWGLNNRQVQNRNGWVEDKEHSIFWWWWKRQPFIRCNYSFMKKSKDFKRNMLHWFTYHPKSSSQSPLHDPWGVSRLHSRKGRSFCRKFLLWLIYGFIKERNCTFSLVMLQVFLPLFLLATKYSISLLWSMPTIFKKFKRRLISVWFGYVSLLNW